MMQDRFSRIVFLVAGIYGIVVLLPGYFGEKMLAEKMPPAITHPEFYYGFFGVWPGVAGGFSDHRPRSAAVPAHHSRGHPGKADVRGGVCRAVHARSRTADRRAWAAPAILSWALYLPFRISGSSRCSRPASCKSRIRRLILPTHIERPTRIQAAGNMPKIIDEYIGRVNLPGNPEDQRLSVAHMRSPAGWQEPGQTPEFEEYTIVLRGRLRVRHKGGDIRCVGGPGRDRPPGRMDPIFDSGRSHRIHRHLSAGIFSADGPSRRCPIKAMLQKKGGPLRTACSLWCGAVTRVLDCSCRLRFVWSRQKRPSGGSLLSCRLHFLLRCAQPSLSRPCWGPFRSAQRSCRSRATVTLAVARVGSFWIAD